MQGIGKKKVKEGKSEKEEMDKHKDGWTTGDIEEEYLSDEGNSIKWDENRQEWLVEEQVEDKENTATEAEEEDSKVMQDHEVEEIIELVELEDGDNEKSNDDDGESLRHVDVKDEVEIDHEEVIITEDHYVEFGIKLVQEEEMERRSVDEEDGKDDIEENEEDQFGEIDKEQEQYHIEAGEKDKEIGEEKTINEAKARNEEALEESEEDQEKEESEELHDEQRLSAQGTCSRKGKENGCQRKRDGCCYSKRTSTSDNEEQVGMGLICNNNSIWEDSETGSAPFGRKRKRAEEEDSEGEQVEKRFFRSEPKQWIQKEAEEFQTAEIFTTTNTRVPRSWEGIIVISDDEDSIYQCENQQIIVISSDDDDECQLETEENYDKDWEDECVQGNQVRSVGIGGKRSRGEGKESEQEPAKKRLCQNQLRPTWAENEYAEEGRAEADGEEFQREKMFRTTNMGVAEGYEGDDEDANRNYIAEDDREDNSTNANHVPVIVISDSDDEEHDEDNNEDHDINDIIEVVDNEEEDIENEGSDGIDHSEEHQGESEEVSQEDNLFREFDFSRVTFFVHVSGCPHSHEE
eukprot:gene9309-10291_t